METSVKRTITVDSFPCIACGACCRRVHLIPDFPEPFNPDGSCSHLQPDNSCGIYEASPLLCRVDDFYEKFLKHLLSKEEFYKLNTDLCEQYETEGKCI